MASEWVQNGMRGPPTGSANLAMDKSPVGARDCRAYFNTLARVVYSLQFPPVDIDGLMCADAITPKRLWRFPGSRQRPEHQSLGEAYSNSESQFGWSDFVHLWWESLTLD